MTIFIEEYIVNSKNKNAIFYSCLVFVVLAFGLISCESENAPLVDEVEITTPKNVRQIHVDEDSLTVTLSYPDDPHAIIRYSTDGTDVSESSTKYSGPFTINQDATVKARAFGGKGSESIQSEQMFYKVTVDYSSITELQAAINSMMSDDNYGVNGDYNHLGLADSLTSLENLFASSSFNGDISAWDVSHVTDMKSMFSGATAFNQTLNNWDVSSVTNMSDMFKGATSFNQSLSNWDVSHVTDMSSMFNGAQAFNQNLSNWDVSHVIVMSNMFNGAISFNQSLSNWDVSHITDMSNMFNGATSFNQSLSNWDVSYVTNMSNMFNGATSFNQTLNNWNVSNVTTMDTMFCGAIVFSSPIKDWDVSSVTNMDYMFAGIDSDNTTIFNQDISDWELNVLSSADGMFENNNAFDQNLTDWESSLTEETISHTHIITNCTNMTTAQLPAKLGGSAL